jgi:hypothetical protein
VTPAAPGGHVFGDVDEWRHADAPVEAWWWWGADAAGTTGLFVGLELHGTSFDYWAGLVRTGEPYLYVDELEGRGLRAGLEIKPAQMWADHVCDVPMRQWSLGNEAHGVLLDDPMEATARAFGEVVPVTFDVEWYGDQVPHVLDGLVPGANGYSQVGEVDAQIELTEGVLELRGPASRLHVWGAPHRPAASEGARPEGLVAPYRRRDGTAVLQVLTPTGWWSST